MFVISTAIEFRSKITFCKHITPNYEVINIVLYSYGNERSRPRIILFRETISSLGNLIASIYVYDFPIILDSERGVLERRGIYLSVKPGTKPGRA